jgi:deoxyribodipyrimidine photo-lyase
MIVASFLTKNLLISWQNGAKWFWDTLVDADLANNSMGWQWVAGCGVDAAPYFRIFNPIAQGQKFDPCAEYIKKWLPELKNLSLEYIYNPWLASTEELKNAGIELGKTYPFPIIDLSQTRNTALNMYQTIKKYL